MFFVRSINYAYDHNMLSITQRHGISTWFSNGKNVFKTLRPFSLLNTVNKIASDSILSISISTVFKLEVRLVLSLGQPINTVMAENKNYHSLQYADLNLILKDKGIPYSNKREGELIGIWESAETLNLPTIGQINDDFDASISRRTVKVKTYLDPHSNTLLNWAANLKHIPSSIDAFDNAQYM